jgi:hypothetical protein
MKNYKVSFGKPRYQGSSKNVIHITKGSGILGEEFQHIVLTKMMDRRTDKKTAGRKK